MMPMNNTLSTAISLANQGYKTYPLTQNTKIPLKGTNGFKMASNKLETVKHFFENNNNNIGLLLENTNLIVIDVDVNHGHNTTNGIDNFRKILLKHKDDFPNDTKVERSANWGLHYFLVVNDKTTLKNKQSAFCTQSGIDILVNGGVVIAPSIVDGKRYTTVKDHTMLDVKPAPQWIIDEIQRVNYAPVNVSQTSTRKKFLGSVLDSIVEPVEPGERNNHIAQLGMKMYWSGAKPVTVFNLMLVSNDFLPYPLSKNEVNTIFKSITKRQTMRGG